MKIISGLVVTAVLLLGSFESAFAAHTNNPALILKLKAKRTKLLARADALRSSGKVKRANRIENRVQRMDKRIDKRTDKHKGAAK